MRIKNVKYERLFPVGAYLNEKIGFEVDLEEPYYDAPSNNPDRKLIVDTPESCIEKLRQIAENIHREKYPQFYENGIENFPHPIPGVNQFMQPETTIEPKLSPIESHIKTINECKTLNNLKIFEKLVTNAKNDDLTNAYMKQHEKLYLQKTS